MNYKWHVILSVVKDLQAIMRSFGRYRFLRMTIILLIFFPACAGDPLFDAIDNNLADPIAIAIDAANDRAYVINANLNIAFTGGSLLVLDLSDPTAPIQLNQTGNPAALDSLSGPLIFDATGTQVFVTNRQSEDKDDVVDTVYQIDVDEGGDFGEMTALNSGEDPFGIVCCDDNDRFYVEAEGTVESYSRADPTDRVSRSLEVSLATGETLNGRSTTHGVILGDQVFLTNRSGRIYVLNADEITDTGANPIDYIITGMNDIRGIATDGTRLYVVEADDTEDDADIVRVIDPSSLTPIDPDVATVTETEIDDVEDATIAIGDDPNEILFFSDNLYVTNTANDTVTVIDVSDPTTPTVVTTIDLTAGGNSADAPFGLAVATLGGTDYLFVTNLESNNISIVDLGTNAVVATFP